MPATRLDSAGVPPLGRLRSQRKIERLGAGTEDAEPTRAAGSPVGCDIDQVHLIDRASRRASSHDETQGPAATNTTTTAGNVIHVQTMPRRNRRRRK